jgi:hypothetical protein
VHRSWLFAPGNHPRRAEKVLQHRAQRTLAVAEAIGSRSRA